MDKKIEKMKKAKNNIEFGEYWNELLERLKKKGKEFIHEIDFEKVWSLIEKRLNKCRARKAMKNKDLV